MKRNGKTSANTQRWRCKSCGASGTRKHASEAKRLKGFVGWLLSKGTQSEMPGAGRTFRRKTSKFWQIWPIAPAHDEAHHVIHVDGIWLGRQVVVLIACTEEFVVGWHLCRAEGSRAWAALMARIAAPDVVVCDGGPGFDAARRAVWPGTRVQRCTFHAFGQVKRCTTTRPKLQAGVELYGIAKGLMGVTDLNGAAEWLASFSNWCAKWSDFLKEKTVVDGKARFKHERLRRARGGLVKLCKAGTLFTYLDEELLHDGPVPATNNRIEGGVNAQLRAMIRAHRGLSLTRRVKAVFWWCYMHTESPMGYAGILHEMPTDSTIAKLYQAAKDVRENEAACGMWGTAVQWRDLHSSSPYRIDYD